MGAEMATWRARWKVKSMGRGLARSSDLWMETDWVVKKGARRVIGSEARKGPD